MIPDEAVEADLTKARRAARTLADVVDKQCRDVLEVTGLHHLIDSNGDGHWDVVWMRLFEMRDELATQAGKLAEAWEAGASAQASAYGMDKDAGPNPYR